MIKELQARMIFKDCKTVADCEEKLNALIESAPVVYCSKPDKENSHLWNHHKCDGYGTHKAHLMFIEEIKKEPCKHETYEKNTFDGAFFGSPWTTSCKHCGVELVATWSEKK